MRASPTGLGVESFLMPLNAIPTQMAGAIVGANRFNDVRRLAIASFASIKFSVCARYHWYGHYNVLRQPSTFKYASVRKLAIHDPCGSGEWVRL